jgi:hypothetical protein
MTTAGICLAFALGGSVSPVFIEGQAFTLAWTHSIEKVRWEEDYRIVKSGDDRSASLVGVFARVRGSGAGMEPGTGARWRDGWFEYPTTGHALTALHLSRSEFVPDYELCLTDGCRPMSQWLPSDGGVTVLTACERDDPG